MTTATFTRLYGTPGQRARTQGWNRCLDAVWTQIAADPARQWSQADLHALLMQMIRQTRIETWGRVDE